MDLFKAVSGNESITNIAMKDSQVVAMSNHIQYADAGTLHNS